MRNIILIIMAVISFSCEKVIDMNIPDKGRKPVLNCVFGDGKEMKIALFKSKHILNSDAGYDIISNALVIVTGDSILPDTLTEIEQGLYQSLSYHFPVGNYSVSVTSEGQTITSYTEIPAAADFTIGDTSTYSLDKDEFFRLDVKLTDAPGIKNYYMLGLKRSGYSGEFYNLSVFSSDPSVTSDYRDRLLFTDDIFDGKSKTVRIEVTKGNLYDQQDSIDLEVELYSLSYDAYMYFVTMQAQLYTSDSPFSEPVVVYSNITDGYGIFAGYSNKKRKIRIPSSQTGWME